MLYNLILKAIRKFPNNTNFYSDGARVALTKQIMKALKEEYTMKLSDQAMGAIMMALQKSLLEQTDIVPILKDFDFEQNEKEQLNVRNPPNFKIDNDYFDPENQDTAGSD